MIERRVIIGENKKAHNNPLIRKTRTREVSRLESPTAKRMSSTSSPGRIDANTNIRSESKSENPSAITPVKAMGKEKLEYKHYLAIKPVKASMKEKLEYKYYLAANREAYYDFF